MASTRSSSATTKDDGPVFPLFNRLPWEIRQMIWEQALPRPIPQVLTYKLSTFPKWDPNTNTWDATDGPPRVPIPPPALLHTTQESRKLALEHVIVRKEEHYGTNLYHRHYVVSRPFDRDTDSLFIYRCHFDDFIKVYMATTPWAARHLVFDLFIFCFLRSSVTSMRCTWDDFESAADRACRGLRSLSLVNIGKWDIKQALDIFSSQAVKGYYRTVPDAEAMELWEGMGERLGAEFSRRQGPNGVPWNVRVGSGGSCSADGREDDEDVLECSQVVIQRFTASTMEDH